MLKAGLRPVWRDDSTLQIGLDPAHAVVIGGLDASAARLVGCLDGTRDLAGLRAAAHELGVTPERAERLLDLLRHGGALDDVGTDSRPMAALHRDERDRLAPDVTAAGLVRGGADGGAAMLARRRAARVGVTGAGRVGATVVTLLAAAGVGAVSVEDDRPTRLIDLAPGGLRSDALGAPRDRAACRAARQVAASVRTDKGRPPQLHVVAATPDPEQDARLLRSGTPHLYVGVRESTAVVGPLVLPGRSSCLRCHDLHRSDRDPAWPTITAQLRGGSPQPGADTVLATAAAAHTVLQALAFLDGEPWPSAVDGTIEIGLADGAVRRRSWSVHPRCGCDWT
jgi:hypothetical protein